MVILLGMSPGQGSCDESPNAPTQRKPTLRALRVSAGSSARRQVPDDV